jgi:hypothetical protein
MAPATDSFSTMRRIALQSSVIVFLCCGSALAWNKPGHMVTGAIAYDVLKREHPEALAKALDVLRHPTGDRGGNEFYPRVREGRAVINLHQFWDGLLTGTQTYREAGNLATELRLHPEFAQAKKRRIHKSA